MKMAIKILAYTLGTLLLLTLIGGGYLLLKFRQQLRDGGKIVEWRDEDGTIYRNQRYGEGSRHTYDLIIPANKQPTAVMLFIHGGSWTSGKKEDMAYEAYRYAQQGYATAVMNYSRLAVDSLDYDSRYEHPSFASMLNEIDLAIKAIKIRGAELGCDFRHMAIGGYSAGGHLAMLYATTHSTQAAIPIRFQISWVGPADINLLFPADYNLIEQAVANRTDQNIALLEEMRTFIQHLTGYKPSLEELNKESIEAYKRDGSPVTHVSTTTPPAILAYGGKDELVNQAHGEKMASVLQYQNIEHHIVIFPDSGHALGENPECTNRVNELITSFCNKYFD